MPYIAPHQRTELEPAISHLIDRIKTYSSVDGVVNYVITTIVARAMKPEEGWKYLSAYKAYGTFLAAAAEFYRRLVAPYEDGAIERNGDIPEYVQKT
jgi:hypothetical protein